VLGNKQLETKLLYRGSDHGFAGWNFKHYHVKGPSIILLKTLNGDCIGAYTSGQWIYYEN
jgi:hypothetical protein